MRDAQKTVKVKIFYSESRIKERQFSVRILNLPAVIGIDKVHESFAKPVIFQQMNDIFNGDHEFYEDELFQEVTVHDFLYK